MHVFFKLQPNNVEKRQKHTASLFFTCYFTVKIFIHCINRFSGCASNRINVVVRWRKFFLITIKLLRVEQNLKSFIPYVLKLLLILLLCSCTGQFFFFLRRYSLLLTFYWFICHINKTNLIIHLRTSKRFVQTTTR